MVTYQATCKRLDELESTVSDKGRMTETLSACREDQNIFDLLKENNLYDPHRLSKLDVKDVNDFKWSSDSNTNISDFSLLTQQELDLLNKTLFDLYPYRGKPFTEHLCYTLSTPKSVYEFGELFNGFLESQAFKPRHLRCGIAGTRLFSVCTFGSVVYREFKELDSIDRTIHQCMDAIRQGVRKLDNLLVGEHSKNFGEKLENLIATIQRTEKFVNERGNDLTDTIAKNLSSSMHEKVQHFANLTMKELQESVGPCKSPAYIQDRGIKYACQHLIDPIVSTPSYFYILSN